MAACARWRACDFPCARGTIHAVLGENGAGKSTLIKIVSGVVQPDDGAISLDGARAPFASPAAAKAAGVVCIFQELSLMPDLSVADNISIATPPRRFGLIDARAQRRRAEALLAAVGCEDVNPAPAGARPAAVAPPDGRDRQGARPEAAASHPRRGDLGADQRRCREGLRAAGAAQGAGRRHPLHLAPHARDRGARGPRLGLPQRPPHRDLRQGRSARPPRSCS